LRAWASRSTGNSLAAYLSRLHRDPRRAPSNSPRRTQSMNWETASSAVRCGIAELNAAVGARNNAEPLAERRAGPQGDFSASGNVRGEKPADMSAIGRVGGTAETLLDHNPLHRRLPLKDKARPLPESVRLHGRPLWTCLKDHVEG